MNTATLITLAVVVDLIVTLALVTWLVRKRGLLGSIGVDLAKIKDFSESVRNLTGDYLHANYGGDTESLPGVLEGLLSQLDQKAREQGVTLNRDALKMVLLRAIASQQSVPTRDAMVALKKVA